MPTPMRTPTTASATTATPRGGPTTPRGGAAPRGPPMPTRAPRRARMPIRVRVALRTLSRRRPPRRLLNGLHGGLDRRGLPRPGHRPYVRRAHRRRSTNHRPDMHSLCTDHRPRARGLLLSGDGHRNGHQNRHQNGDHDHLRRRTRAWPRPQDHLRPDHDRPDVGTGADLDPTPRPHVQPRVDLHLDQRPRRPRIPPPRRTRATPRRSRSSPHTLDGGGCEHRARNAGQPRGELRALASVAKWDGRAGESGAERVGGRCSRYRAWIAGQPGGVL